MTRLTDPDSTKIERWLRLALQLGVPSLIALFLVYRLSEASGIREMLVGHIYQSQVNHTIDLQVLRQICLNTSKDDDQRRACMVPEIATLPMPTR